jgi:hypothetical protein
MTLGGAAAAGVCLIVWCWDCGRQVEPDPAELAGRYGAEVTVLSPPNGKWVDDDWHPSTSGSST